MGGILALIGAISLLILWRVVAHLMGTGLDSATEALGRRQILQEVRGLALEKARATIIRHMAVVGAYPGFNPQELDAAIDKGIEAQLMALAFSTALIDITLQDAAYDKGLLSPADQMMGRPAPGTLSPKDLHQAVWELWGPGNAARTKLSNLYRLFAEEGGGEPSERAFYEGMRRWCHAALVDEYSHHLKPNVKWLEFVGWMGRGNLDSANAIVDEITLTLASA